MISMSELKPVKISINRPEDQQLDEKHPLLGNTQKRIFKTLMQNVDLRQRIIKMYHELKSQQKSSLMTPTTEHNAPLVDSSQLQMQQSVMSTTHGVVPSENRRESDGCLQTATRDSQMPPGYTLKNDLK